MPLSLLAPLFLAGLALLAIPVLVHLTRRDRQTPTAFPSLMFVPELRHESVRRRRLRHWPLLLLRCLALALVVLAFARPFVDRAEARIVPPGTGGREVVILLDRSYSMGAGDRWARATAEARRAVDGLTSGDRATLIVFDNAPRTLADASADRAALRLALDSARIGAGATRYTPALAAASQILARSPLRTREAVLITDFQRTGWQADPEARLPVGARLVPVDVGGPPPPNVAVTGVELQRDASGERERVAPTARLTSTEAVATPGGAGGAARDVAVTLEVNGRVAETRSVRLPASGAASVSFAPVPLADGWTRGTVRAGTDRLPADNAFHFTAERGEVVRVLVVEGRDARATSSLYLRRAFSVGGRTPFRVETRPVRTLQAADLADRTVVILNDAPPSAAAARLLVDYVRRGGGLVVALGGASSASAWPADAAPLLPATPGAVVDRADVGGARLATVERGHPVFAPFAAPRSGDVTAARVLRYRAIAATDATPAIARFDDGAPALVEHAVGAGRVLVWASTLDTFWGDLPVQPVFVPLVHQLATYVGRRGGARPWLTAGETLDLAPTDASVGDAAGRWVVETPAGRRVRVGGERGRAAVTLDEQGFYGVWPAERADARPRAVAVNLDATEADLARVEPAEMVRTVEGGAATVGEQAATAGDAVALTRPEREARQGAWWYLLALALAVLAIEAALANWLSRGARGTPTARVAST